MSAHLTASPAVSQVKPKRFDIYEPPSHFASFVMLDDGHSVATRGTADHWFRGQVFMPAYNTREGAVMKP